MKEFFIKLIGILIFFVIILPIITAFIFLSNCRNYLYSIIISTFTFYLLLGFTGVSFFLSISTIIVLTTIGSYLHKKGLELIDDDMNKKMNNLTEEEKSQVNRRFKIDDILGRIGNIGS